MAFVGADGVGDRPVDEVITDGREVDPTALFNGRLTVASLLFLPPAVFYRRHPVQAA
jgi:hypothetical protein